MMNSKQCCKVDSSQSLIAHFLKNVTLSCPTGGMLPRAACHWLTHNSYWLTQLSAVSSPTSPGQYTAHAQQDFARGSNRHKFALTFRTENLKCAFLLVRQLKLLNTTFFSALLFGFQNSSLKQWDRANCVTQKVGRSGDYELAAHRQVFHFKMI